nr:wall-associated receptor kinase-like 1 [Aegilops tauschii subsp. strangulata]
MVTSWVSVAALLLLMSVPMVVAVDPPTTMPNCNATCGDVSVPYPFGMGPARCYRPGFKLTCDHGSKPPRLLLGEGGAGALEVVNISLRNTTVRVIRQGVYAVNMSDSGDGVYRWSWSLAVGGGGVLPYPYILGQDLNELILTGCNVQVTLQRMNGSSGHIVSGCASFCSMYLMVTRDEGGNICSNLGCCQSYIPAGDASYGVELKRLGGGMPRWRMYLEYNAVNVLVAEMGWLNYDRIRRLRVALGRTAAEVKVPMILRWAVPYGAAPTDRRHDNYTGICPADADRTICKSTNSQCVYETTNTSTGFFFREKG